MKRVIFETAVGGLDLGDEDKVQRITRLATQLAQVDREQGWEMRAILNVALVVTSCSSKDTAYALGDAAAFVAHACGISLDECLQHVREGYELAQAAHLDIEAIMAAQKLARGAQ